MINHFTWRTASFMKEVYPLFVLLVTVTVVVVVVLVVVVFVTVTLDV